jgi:hypothetical protein
MHKLTTFIIAALLPTGGLAASEEFELVSFIKNSRSYARYPEPVACDSDLVKFSLTIEPIEGEPGRALTYRLDLPSNFFDGGEFCGYLYDQDTILTNISGFVSDDEVSINFSPRTADANPVLLFESHTAGELGLLRVIYQRLGRFELVRAE